VLRGRVRNDGIPLPDHASQRREWPPDLSTLPEAFYTPLLTSCIGNSNDLFHRPLAPALTSARTPRAAPPGATPHRTSGWLALDAAGRPQARTAVHVQDGWLVTGSLLGLPKGAANVMRTA
jgi:hypothetical protein